MSKSERDGLVMAASGESEAEGISGQGAGPSAAAPPPRAARVAGYLAVLSLPLWMSQLSTVWLLAGAAATLGWIWHAARARDGWALAAAVALCAALGAGLGVQARLGEIARDWPRLQLEIEDEAAAAVNQGLDELVERGEAAVDRLEALAGGTGARTSPARFAELEAIQEETGVTALALFDARGVPVAWAGEHRGTIPPEVRRGVRRYTSEEEPLFYVFEEGPLFTYLYFVRPLPGGRVAVAAALLESDLPLDQARAPFAERFAERQGLTPRFVDPARAAGESVWDWATSEPILSVSFTALTQQHWWERVVRRGRQLVAALGVAAFLLLGAIWYRRRRSSGGVVVAVAALSLVLAPLGQMTGADDLFSPLQFVLPVPGDITLGALLILLVGVAVWLLTRERVGDPRLVVPWWAQAMLAAALYPLAVMLVDRSAAGGLLARSPAGGMPLQLATTLLLALPSYLLLSQGERSGGRRGRGGALLVAGAAAAVVLAVALVAAWHPDRPLHPWTAALWAIPFALVARGLGWIAGERSRIRVWLAAGWLAGSAAIPQLWVMHTGAELANAERELSSLGTQTDPFLDFLLQQFAERAATYAREGERGVNLLYHSWVASGLAREGYEARLTIWRDGEPESELRLSEQDSLPGLVAARVRAMQGVASPAVEQYEDVESLHYLLLAPLPGGRVVSAAVPPRRQLGRSTALARFLRAGSESERAAYNETLYLVPAAEAAEMPPHGRVGWTRTEHGWRSEALAHFPAGPMHAHLFVRTPGYALVAARALLAQAALLGIVLLMWLAARAMCGEIGGLPVVRQQWVRSFRGRLTLTLVLFFLIPTVAFGAVAFGAVSREVVLSAASLARRALDQAAPLATRERLSRVGTEVRADLLLYEDGLLVNAASPEVLGLGLFHSWLPPEVYLDFASGEDTEALEERRLGENEYLVAYRRLAPESVLAVPVPLASEEVTRRQREFRDVALLVSLLGAGLAVVLSILAGRTLSRPLDELSRATATVGAGNLRVRLPEQRPDEFGSVYRSFNRMVRRLRRARAALVRETRRTETIVSEAATGVLALDAEGNLELVNPRAAEILGVEPVRGVPLPAHGAVLAAVHEALDQFRRSGAAEAGRELDVDGRILRLRLRQLTGGEEVRGTVVALEDVTSEIRTARVLAWGEMAQQVAHEIKNPLTPIKLSVQHLRRAHADQRADFAVILERNVEAILEEIDRLGEIARAFARFGTPQPPSAPLERVDLARAIQETLALYRSGGGAIDYRLELEGAAGARVVARTGEFKEVLVNLLENAREALDGAGAIGVRAGAMDDGRVEVVVWDTGEGIPQELLARVFEPHFSTRTSGTGLGLAIVRRMVESWGGEIGAESEPGAGTRMRMRLAAATLEP